MRLDRRRHQERSTCPRLIPIQSISCFSTSTVKVQWRLSGQASKVGCQGLTEKQVLSVKDLKTPLLCVRCWKLADYLQLESFKSVATSSLEDHLDAMALLASNDLELENINPKWLRYFLDAFREVCADKGSKKLHETFITFLWVTRFEMLQLSKILEILERHPDMNRKMLDLLVWNEFLEKPDWLPNTKNIEQDIQNRKGIAFKDGTYCARCVKELNVGEGPRFYNPFPAGHSRIGQLMWCKRCTFQLNESRDWPWRNGRQKWKNKFPIEAWSWSDEE